MAARRLTLTAACALLGGMVVVGCSSTARPTTPPAGRSATLSTSFAAPAQIDGLTRSTNAHWQDNARHRVKIISNRHMPQPVTTIAEFYTGDGLTDTIEVSAVAGPVADPAAVVRDLMAIGKLQDVRPAEPGTLGGTASCGIASAGITMKVTACTWADAGSIGMLNFMSLDGKDRRADFAKYRQQFQQAAPAKP